MEETTKSENIPAPLSSVSRLIETVHRLRAPGGCPWDREQTHQTLRQNLIEEAYEVLEVLDRIHSSQELKDEKLRGSLREELGDLMMQVLLHSEIADEAGAFNIFDVAEALNDKLVRRHPHVFGASVLRADSADAALKNWERQKAQERKTEMERDGAVRSVLDGTPKMLPALQKASRIIEKVSKVGFQWKDLAGPLEKLDEELREFKDEIQKMKKEGTSSLGEPKRRVQEELGDLLFCLCNLAYFLKVDPEASLRGTLDRFESRFRHVEDELRKLGKTPDQSNLEEMDRFWEEAKSRAKD